MLEVRQEPDGRIVVIGEAVIHHVKELHEGLAAHLEPKRRPARVCLNELSEIDSAGIQVFLAFRRHLGRDGAVLIEWPKEIKNRLARLGVAHQLLDEE